MKNTSRIAVGNINHPGKERDVEAVAYDAMKRAILEIVASRSSGLTVAEIQDDVLPLLPEQLFGAR